MEASSRLRRRPNLGTIHIFPVQPERARPSAAEALAHQGKERRRFGGVYVGGWDRLRTIRYRGRRLLSGVAVAHTSGSHRRDCEIPEAMRNAQRAAARGRRRRTRPSAAMAPLPFSHPGRSP